ncbi:squalene--hopene cyclase [Paraburkholderia caballeronis]|uniref:Squalene-hopene/tetraprenyl-beta-curcumene cyclase n=1 Tax=Paraburkholderia caballeronis TaxID=416943 RepID=A0A1H7VS81_9BURK|nr:squalene--hopene cyclase [Paraburkholderia caballeronis]PXW15473.1 squalene-hopene/tetraprenyl-beta-curcumene cyclase [Paraburkholderia caballeronis]PXW93758.1 squalene-hopene/tetraprenyl-beta-curcumene cyclase [Paraburkholderia caballeronis]RAJ88998.1 squalene-hopene/tetraprenyl-beta-curcumene cyclase [Paraburkholderia caballeronis]TDV05095.1 squalene-hopene/tetraprenyl-beta-curcumene cyclase [Paraburkholderia caballeronis]TDV08210.1 squalene-hopene/tetraprenyl-beta-curcumene cyclase [Para
MNDLSHPLSSDASERATDLIEGVAAADIAPIVVEADAPAALAAPTAPADPLEASVARATDALLAAQKPDGHWVYELEADATIPAEYVLLVHYLGETANLELERKIARYLRRIQLPDGGWPLFTDGAMDVSASVKAYFALKMIGDADDAAHMVRARSAILAAGGAEASNVFTRILLALFGVVSWYAVPMMPVEITLLPKWFPFHLSKVSYWARTVIVPLLVLNAKRPVARNPRGVRIDELFRCAPVTVGLSPRAPHQSKGWFSFFRAVDGVLRVTDPLFPTYLRQRAIDAAVAFVDERLNGEDGLGAIFPAMANAVMMYDVLGYPADHPHRAIARQSVEKLLVVHDDEAYCQPCLSPVWDTSLAAHALLETGDPRAEAAVRRGLDWLRPLQILDVRGDWISRRPDVRPGGWAFQYANPHYPDVDDTAVVAMAMQRVDTLDKSSAYEESIARAREWVVGMQSSDGGWGAFEPENTQYYLNNIPFSDHGALLDPPTADVSGRCLSMLAQIGELPAASEPARRAYDYLLKEQEADGSWYGRWGMNYIYGTWTALCALNAGGLPHDDPRMKRAVQWLVAIQNEDGGWGEDGTSYKLDYRGYEPAASTASQTAWALLGLMAAGAVNHPAVARGIAWLQATQRDHGLWDEERFTATGFPRVFYLRYHGYRKFFPLWALARYRNLKRDGSTRVTVGM